MHFNIEIVWMVRSCRSGLVPPLNWPSNNSASGTDLPIGSVQRIAAFGSEAGHELLDMRFSQSDPKRCAPGSWQRIGGDHLNHQLQAMQFSLDLRFWPWRKLAGLCRVQLLQPSHRL